MANTIKIKQSSVAAKIPLAADLLQGELAINTADEKLYTKNSSGVVVELGTGSSISGAESSVEFTATSGQTTFATIYDVDHIQVFLNGIRLDEADYVAINGTTVVLNTAAALNDVVFLQASLVFTFSEHYKKSETDTLLDAKVDDSQVLTNVPSGALFTDTVYDSTAIDAAVALNTAKTTNVSTNLGYTQNGAFGLVTSSDGTNATLPAATASLAGLQTGADKTKLDGIESGATVFGDASSTSLAAATATVIFSMPLATYRSAKLMITATQGTKYESVELMVMHNGTVSFHNEFGAVFSVDDFITLTTDVSGANVRVLASTPAISVIKVNAQKQPV